MYTLHSPCVCTPPPSHVMRGCGCVGVWVPGSAPHTYTFDKRVYICCLAASCRKRYIVRRTVTGVTGDSRPYVLYII